MNLKNKSNWFWVGVALTVINFTFLGTVVYHLFPEKNVPVINEPMPQQERMRGFMIRELGLNSEQQQEVAGFQKEYNSSSFLIKKELENLRTQMIQELHKNNPDSIKLDQLSHKMGDLNYQLRTITWKHFMDLKKICTPEQQERLLNIYNNLLSPEKFQRRNKRHRRGGKGRFQGRRG
jgi:Spy/CpxP family protein refolding chaperone